MKTIIKRTKKKKFYGFENWLQWADLTEVMIEKKEVWDVIDRSHIDLTTTFRIQKKRER